MSSPANQREERASGAGPRALAQLRRSGGGLCCGRPNEGHRRRGPVKGRDRGRAAASRDKHSAAAAGIRAPCRPSAAPPGWPARRLFGVPGQRPAGTERRPAGCRMATAVGMNIQLLLEAADYLERRERGARRAAGRAGGRWGGWGAGWPRAPTPGPAPQKASAGGGEQLEPSTPAPNRGRPRQERAGIVLRIPPACARPVSGLRQTNGRGDRVSDALGPFINGTPRFSRS